MIPKIIHYCWFGKNKKNKKIKNCIESWKKFFPDYKIIEWNEDNTNINENDYVREAYRLKKWAYVSDFIRMKILYEYGGIYFDVDVEVIKPFPQELFSLKAFSGYEAASKCVSPGLIFACEKENEIVKELLESYENDKFEYKSPEKIITINKRITNILGKYGYIPDDILQVVNNLTIFPNEVFCGYDGEKRCTMITDKTLSVHHYAASWLPWYRKIRLKFGTMLRHIKYKINKKGVK